MFSVISSRVLPLAMYLALQKQIRVRVAPGIQCAGAQSEDAKFYPAGMLRQISEEQPFIFNRAK